MKNTLYLLLLSLLSIPVFGQYAISNTEATTETIAIVNNAPDIAIIPEPVSVIKSEGYFILPSNVVIQAPATPELKQVIAFLQERLSIPTGNYVAEVSTPSANPTINLILNEKVNSALGKEGYQLLVTPNHITIKANKPAGLFYGVQSLIQLFPKEIESKEVVENIEWKAPCVEITDYPRVGWRGLMFDVARHFFTKA